LGEIMRHTMTFVCEGENLAATLDVADGEAGLLIVSGGNEIRVGAHRSMAKLAADVAAQGHSVFRFDRRGIGDSEGENRGFAGSKSDIEAALAAFQMECPHLKKIVAFGNCDAASALTLHQPSGVSHFVLANPWVFAAEADCPAPAAVRAHYQKRIFDFNAWKRLLTGGVSVRQLVRGLVQASAPAGPSTLVEAVGAGLSTLPCPVSIILAEGDNTAIAFRDQWERSSMRSARARRDISVVSLQTASHSFAEDKAYDGLKLLILKILSEKS
jgi:exosortase A-associated hydrolase 1